MGGLMDIAPPEPMTADHDRDLVAQQPGTAVSAEPVLDSAAPPIRGLSKGGAAAGAPVVQAKLAVGASDDPLELEADLIAHQAVEFLGARRSDAAQAAPSEAPDIIGRRLAAMRHADHDGAGVIGPEGGELGGNVEAMLRRQRSGGQALPEAARQQMESAMGTDFSGVRVHSGPEATELNREISAHAFTVDNHVFFRDGMPDTSSPDGQHLLAHELAHTIQQSPGPARRSTIRREGEDEPKKGRRPKKTEGGGSGASTGVMFMDPSGVGHREPDKAPSLPSVMHMDTSGVAHKEPDKSKTPAVMYMDSSGVGHKEPDKAPSLPSVMHMDSGGVAHDKADDVLPEVAGARTNYKSAMELYLPHVTAVKDAGPKWEGFKTTAQAREQDADTALKAAQAVWNVEAANSGLVSAQQAEAAKTASVAAAKAKTDAQALKTTSFDPAWSQLAAQNKALNDNLAQFKKDKALWLKTASPMTKAAIDEIQGFFDQQTTGRTAAQNVKNARDAQLAEIDRAATEAENSATATVLPLSTSAKKLYAVTGVVQQKLNMANGTRITVNALFDGDTESALKKFQKAQGLPETGVVDVATWTALDLAAPSAIINGQHRVEDEEKSKTANPEAGVHPKLSFPTSGPAVRELQNRLNNWQATVVGKKPFDAMSVDGIFGIKTRSAVKSFQKAHGIKQTAVVEDSTWAELDKQGSVEKGVREFETSQIVEGMLTGGQAHYDWEVTKDNRLVITVKINFTGEKKHPKVAAWLQDITDVWNHYKAVEDGGIREYDIEFKPVVSSSGHHKVKVRKPTKADPNPRSDSANWYVNDTRKGLAPHEFGHLVGLDDEYNRPEEQYAATTGQEPSVGKLNSASGKTSTQIAALIHTAITDNADKAGRFTSKALAKIVRDEGIEQGAFARLVAERYLTAHPFSATFTNWCAGAGRPATFTTYLAYESQNDWTGDLTTATEAFSESNTSIMGTMESAPDGADSATIGAIAPHDHPVQPRHLRSFTELLVQAMPGTKWKTVKR
jgi:peptidoglycan hydrolase-like protein with peptidoglycan-binding domain